MFQLLKALRGDSGIIECGFVASEVTEAKYFSTPLELGVRRVLFRPKKKICGFPVSRPYLAFGRRNPDPKLFYWIMLVSVSTYRKSLWKIEI
jgi:hypothetical protein